MRHLRPLFALVCLGLLPLTSRQAATPAAANFGGGPMPPPAEALSLADVQTIETAIAANQARLRAEGKLPLAVPQQVSLIWPLQAPNLADPGYSSISNFVDHNPAYPNQLLDYHTGTRTYDTAGGYNHGGVDIFLWPFWWNLMDSGQVEVIAAAAGIIIHKSDGNPDRSCTFNNTPWNAVYVQHADGSVLWYGHLKNGSVTSKLVGETVAQGERLGTVGSSGNSTGPHLHLELHEGNQVTDPFFGPANPTTASSWWANQRPYNDPAINKIATHDAPPDFATCPNPEVPHFADSFVSSQRVYFATYYRDQQAGMPTQYTVYRPDDTVWQQWSGGSASSYAASYWYWYYTLPSNAPAGTWRFTASFNGLTTTTYFNVNAPPAISVSSPNGGERWDRQLAHAITWADNLGGEVNIALYFNGVYTSTLATNLPSTGQYLWTPGPTHPTGTAFTVRVSSVLNSAVYDASNAPFSILPLPPPALSLTPTVSVSTPVPGETLNYVLKITNSGTGPATAAQLTNPLPVGLSPAGAITLSPAGLGTAGVWPNIVTQLTLAPGQAVTVTLPVRVNLGQAAGTLITNTTTLTSTEVLTPVTTSTILTVADAPLVAQDDFFLLLQDTPATLDPLHNDGDPNGDALTLTALGLPLSGTAQLGNGNVVYTPTLGFLGTDVFSYTVSTSRAQATATMTVQVVLEIFQVFLPFSWR